MVWKRGKTFRISMRGEEKVHAISIDDAKSYARTGKSTNVIDTELENLSGVLREKVLTATRSAVDELTKKRGAEGNTKALIMEELLKSDCSDDDLKNRLKEKYGVKKDNFYEHMHGINGLMNGGGRAIIVKKKGTLNLNLRNPEAMVKIMDHFIEYSMTGNIKRRVLDRVFLRCFVSNFGDVPFIVPDMNDDLDLLERLHSDPLSFKEDENIMHRSLELAGKRRYQLVEKRGKPVELVLTTRLKLAYIFQTLRSLNLLRVREARERQVSWFVSSFWPTDKILTAFANAKADGDVYVDPQGQTHEVRQTFPILAELVKSILNATDPSGAEPMAMMDRLFEPLRNEPRDVQKGVKNAITFVNMVEKRYWKITQEFMLNPLKNRKKETLN